MREGDKMENGEEREARSAYYRISEQEKYHSSRIVKEIGGVTYDTHDRETQLICESEKAIAGYVGEVPNQKLKQLYRTKDGKYFIRRDGEIEPINIETA